MSRKAFKTDVRCVYFLLNFPSYYRASLSRAISAFLKPSFCVFLTFYYFFFYLPTIMMFLLLFLKMGARMGSGITPAVCQAFTTFTKNHHIYIIWSFCCIVHGIIRWQHVHLVIAVTWFYRPSHCHQRWRN